ncbi:MAG TPA: hypothetical protein VKY26_05250, partial [Actinomycetota bacterium]|nr:hypothetical protein [Actinomycetota bacterium]
SLVLQARTTALEQAGRQARAAAEALSTEPDYADLLDRLRRLASGQLSEEARVVADPAGRPGLIAEVDGRRVDYRLATIADRVLAGLGPDLERLWQ